MSDTFESSLLVRKVNLTMKSGTIHRVQFDLEKRSSAFEHHTMNHCTSATITQVIQRRMF